ncbi:MAG TPA: alcohol dehydrogenase catalytic domain-containing protein [bacterium]|nr:alcohol dehydrogenase catalytic domain-containing protein [bacterium]
MKALYFDNSLTKAVALKALSVFDKYAALGKLSPSQYAEVPEPTPPNARWLKVRNRSCGLCGTDVHFLFMEMDPGVFAAATPGIKRKFLGHELVGEVIEVGAEVDTVAVGDRVAMRIDWPSCFQLEIEPTCPRCAEGSYMLCENLGKKELPDGNTGGGFSPRMIMHRTQPFKIPPKLSHERALLLEPTASALHGVLRRPPRDGDKVLVVGAGTIGLLTTAIVKAQAPEAKVGVVARYDFQARMAERLGADQVFLGGKNLYARLAEYSGAKHYKAPLGNEILLGGFDVVYDTVGNDRSLHDALRWAAGGGHVVLMGINFKPGKIDYSPIWNQEVTVSGMNCHASERGGKNSFELAVKLLAKDDFAVEGLITHRFPMHRYQDAVKAFLGKGREQAIKIVLDHE